MCMESELHCSLLQCSAENMQCMSNARCVWYFKLCCEILLLLNMTGMGWRITIFTEDEGQSGV